MFKLTHQYEHTHDQVDARLLRYFRLTTESKLEINIAQCVKPQNTSYSKYPIWSSVIASSCLLFWATLSSILCLRFWAIERTDNYLFENDCFKPMLTMAIEVSTRILCDNSFNFLLSYVECTWGRISKNSHLIQTLQTSFVIGKIHYSVFSIDDLAFWNENLLLFTNYNQKTA